MKTINKLIDASPVGLGIIIAIILIIIFNLLGL